MPTARAVLIALLAGSLPVVASFASEAGRDATPGEVRSATFTAPPMIALRVAGGDGATVALELAETGERRELAVESWQAAVEATWVVPREWRGREVAVVASSPSGEVALRPDVPEARSVAALAAGQAGMLLLPVVVAFVALVLLLPGVACLVALPERLRAPPGLALALAMLATAAIGYATFWVWLADHRAGWGWSVTVALVSAVVVASRRSRAAAVAVDPGFARPAILLLLVAALYLGILYAGGDGIARDQVAITRFFYERPLDNIIPELLADDLYDGADPRSEGGEWTTSDRPPLQTGIVLLARPLCDAAGIASELQYQVTGTLLQCMWVPVLWAFCSMAGAAGRERGVVFTLAVCSGFFLFNAVYVWPKLLAASLVALAIVLLLRRDGEAPGGGTLALAALASSLGLVAHTGVAFTLIGAAVVLGGARVVRPARDAAGIALGIAVAVVLLAPWLAYQTFYDPPGDRLVKLHFAGVSDPDDRRGAGEAIVEAWRSLPARELAERKLRNLATLTGAVPLMSSALYAEDGRVAREAAGDAVVRIRTREQQHVVPCLGVVSLGWIGLGLMLARREARARRLAIAAATGCAGLLVASFLLHAGGGAVTTHLSYGDIILLQFSLALGLCSVSRRVVMAALLVQVAWFGWLWIVTAPPVPSFALERAPGLVAWAVAALAAAAIAMQLRAIARGEKRGQSF